MGRPAGDVAFSGRAFGAENRDRLLTEWFAGQGTPTADSAWRHVYGLLLWIDRTTGLAHCYESDKSQPGRHWYARSLYFHDWVSAQFGVSPRELSGHIDWLFRRATRDLAEELVRAKERAIKAAEAQRQPFGGRGLPMPGEDPALAQIVQATLRPYLRSAPPDGLWSTLAERLQSYFAQENKRKNLVGEGFEDVIAAVADRVLGRKVRVRTRVPIGDVPGFSDPGKRKKIKKVDVVLLLGKRRARVLVTAKWSIRADREEQFLSDFEEYTRLEREGEAFTYTLVTNEFDPARLLAACENRKGNRPLFDQVVHVNPHGVLIAYGDAPQRSAKLVAEHVRSGRLISLTAWLNQLGA